MTDDTPTGAALIAEAARPLDGDELQEAIEDVSDDGKCKNCGTALAPMMFGNKHTSFVALSCPKGCGILAHGTDTLFDHINRARIDIRPSCIECHQPWMPGEGIDAQVTACPHCMSARDLRAEVRRLQSVLANYWARFGAIPEDEKGTALFAELAALRAENERLKHPDAEHLCISEALTERDEAIAERDRLAAENEAHKREWIALRGRLEERSAQCAEAISDRDAARLDIAHQAEQYERTIAERDAQLGELRAALESLVICEDNEEGTALAHHLDVARSALATDAGRGALRRLQALERVLAAARVECAKFNFPDEDRPELHEAIAEYDALAAQGKQG